MPVRKRLPQARVVKATARMVRDHAALQGLSVSDRRAHELAADLERHMTAIDAASARLDFSDEPAQFVALLRPTRTKPSKRR